MVTFSLPSFNDNRVQLAFQKLSQQLTRLENRNQSSQTSLQKRISKIAQLIHQQQKHQKQLLNKTKRKEIDLVKRTAQISQIRKQDSNQNSKEIKNIYQEYYSTKHQPLTSNQYITIRQFVDQDKSIQTILHSNDLADFSQYNSKQTKINKNDRGNQTTSLFIDRKPKPKCMCPIEHENHIMNLYMGNSSYGKVKKVRINYRIRELLN